MKPRLVEVKLLVYTNVDLYNLKDGILWDDNLEKHWENYAKGYFLRVKKYSSKIVNKYYKED